MQLRNGAKSLEVTSQNTADSIFVRQNDSFLLQCQVAQRSEYSMAKQLIRWKMIFTLIFALLSVIASILDIDLLSAISSFLAVALVLFNKSSDEKIKATKKHAASIQQYIDVTLFAPITGTSESDWGDVLNRSDLAETVSKYSNHDTSEFINWYSDYSLMNGESQIFYCQSENVRWDYTLHKEFRKLYVILLSIITLVLITIFLIVNPSFVKAFCILAWFLPIAEHCVSVIKEVDNSITILNDAHNFSKDLEKKLKTSSFRTLKRELIKLQYKIWERREKGYLIPDKFYKCYRGKQQKQEDSIAQTIQNLDK